MATTTTTEYNCLLELCLQIISSTICGKYLQQKQSVKEVFVAIKSDLAKPRLMKSLQVDIKERIRVKVVVVAIVVVFLVVGC
jgi:hypothetical protein